MVGLLVFFSMLNRWCIVLVICWSLALAFPVAAVVPAPTLVWNTTLGGGDRDYATAVQQTADGGYVVAGRTASNDQDIELNHGAYDFWIVKLDGSGPKVWNQTLGGNENDVATAVQQTADGGYVVGGYTNSDQTGDVGRNHGGDDYWICRFGGSILPTPSGSASFAAYPQSGPAPHLVQFLDYTQNAKSWS